MFCINCGAQLPEGSRFCNQCGAQLPAAGQAAPVQQPVYQQPVQPVYQQPVYQQPMYQQPMRQLTGAMVMEIGDMTMYEGEPKMGIYRAMGKMTLFDDRIEYKKTAGDGRASIISAAGQIWANQKVKKQAPVVYYLQDIAEVRTGKYMMFTTLVLQFVDGTVLSFAPKNPGSKIALQAVSTIRQYML